MASSAGHALSQNNLGTSFIHISKQYSLVLDKTAIMLCNCDSNHRSDFALAMCRRIITIVMMIIIVINSDFRHANLQSPVKTVTSKQLTVIETKQFSTTVRECQVRVTKAFHDAEVT